MKTSFYFVCWILIYPILNILGVSSNYSFLVALVAILLLSNVIRRHMSNIIAYDNIWQKSRICELAFLDKIGKIKHQLNTTIIINFIWVLYLIITSISILFEVIHGHTEEILYLLIFVFILYGSSVLLLRIIGARRLMSNPSTFTQGIDGAFGVDYYDYYYKRIKINNFENMLPPRPKNYSGYLGVTIFFSIIGCLLGIGTLIYGVIIITGFSTLNIISSMMFLYGGLALFYGIRDTADALRSIRPTK